MSRLNVSPTRMVLLDIRRRAKSARRGHKLLKDKQDGLMHEFLLTIREAHTKRAELQDVLQKAFRTFLVAGSWLSREELENALAGPGARLSVSVTSRVIMGVRVPEFRVQREGEAMTYGAVGTNALLDDSIRKFDHVLEDMLRLGELEKKAERIALELETTRRRVNALEHRMIPDLEDTIAYVSMRLSETERSAIVTTMRIKAAMTEE